MINFIWKLIGPYLVQLAITVGLPAAMQWLMEKGLPQWLVSGLINIVKDAIEEITKVKSDESLTPAEKKDAVREIKRGAKEAARQHCVGGMCQSGLVGE